MKTTISTPTFTAAEPASPRTRVPAWLGAASLVLVAVGLAAVLLELGYYRLPEWLSPGLLHAVQTVTAALILVLVAWRIAKSPQPWEALWASWPEWLALAGSLAAAGVMSAQPRWQILVQAWLLLSAVVYAARLAGRAVQVQMDPLVMLVGSFTFLALAGGSLLWLPRAVSEGTPRLYFGDALFTAVSAVCVTGLSFEAGSDFSRLGQTVLLCLVQLGALLIITAGSLLVLRGGRLLGAAARPAGADGSIAGQTGAAATDGQIVEAIVLSTLLIELIGACLLVRVWGAGGQAVFAAIFHSVMAFCSAGFALQKDSLISLGGRWEILLVIPLLSILGTLGFPVLLELTRSTPAAAKGLLGRLLGLERISSLPIMTAQTRVVVAVTLLLTIIGPLGIHLLDPAAPVRSVGQAQDTTAGLKGQTALSDWQRMPASDRLIQSWYTGTLARSGGLVTMDPNELSSAGKLWVIVLMLIGGSPASAAGGLGTLTWAILIAVLWSALRRRPRPGLLGTPLSSALVGRAIALSMLYLGTLVLGTLALLLVQGPSSRFMDVLFEAVSAFGTAGMSLGETLRLKVESRFVLAMLMILGRLGPLVLLISLARGGEAEAEEELVLA